MTSKKEDFCSLHTHSDASALDGAGKVDEFVKTAAERGNPAIAFSEHGTMRNFYQVHNSCEKHRINPIYGIEFYVCRDMKRKGLTEEEKNAIGGRLKLADRKEKIKDYEQREGIRQRTHLTCWAKNNVGLQNLFRLSSESYIDGFYYKPRIDLKRLIEFGEGLIVGTGCMSSAVNSHVLSGQRHQAFTVAEQLHERFGEDLYIEVQPHNMFEQVEVNKFALELKKRFGQHTKLLATQDAHYVLGSDACHHEVLLCIGTNGRLSDPNHFCFSNEDFFMKTRKQMYNSFLNAHPYMTKKQIKEALDSTVELAEGVDAKVHIDYHAALLPHVELPQGHADEWSYLKSLCSYGLGWREIPERAKLVAVQQGISYSEMLKVYSKRLKYELTAIRKQGFISYFLVVYDLYVWARNQNIMCGPGRGSVAGSLVSFLLGFTSVDPIEHGLIFERFINPDRVDLPDIDMDFMDSRRQEVFEYLRQRYGEDKVAQIATIGKLSGKQCIKDVSRVLEVPYAASNEVTSFIIERAKGDERVDQTVEDSFKDVEVCRQFNEKYPDVLKHAKRLEGMAKNLGIHAAGIVVAPEPLVKYLPLEVRKSNDKNVVVTAVGMKGVAALGLVKLDVLGLRTLTVLRDCLDAIEERHGKKIDLESDVSLVDDEVLQLFTDHDYVGIFQYDTASADKVCAGVKFESFDDIVALTALNRPGTMRSGLAEKYVARKKNPEKVKELAFHSSVSEITKDTLGIIVYQEHVIKIFTDVAGFSPSKADSLRKSIGKSEGDEVIGKERENFIEGAVARTGMTVAEAEKIINAIVFFGGYAFNRSHSCAYSLIAFWCMYLKCHYPLEFYWALLKNEPQLIKIQNIVRDAKNHNTQLSLPDVSTSKESFTIDLQENIIHGSLVDIKGVGEKAAATIIDNQPYADFLDFYHRVDKRKCHKGVVMALAKSGALDKIIPNAKWFIGNLEVIWTTLGKYQASSPEHEQIGQMILSSKKKPSFSKEEKQLVVSSVSPLAVGRHLVDAYKDFIGREVAVPLVSMSDEDFFKNHDQKNIYVYGVIVKVKYNQIGDFHTGDLLTEEERERNSWGARYASVDVEDAGGAQNRIKFDVGIFDEMRPIIDSGAGTPVIVCANVNARYSNLRANFAIDLESYRKKVITKKALNCWEKIIQGEHPVLVYPWKTDSLRKRRIENEIAKADLYRQGPYCGVVTQVKTKIDKRDQEMAFFNLAGVNEQIDIVCFGSHWNSVKDKIKMGNLIVMGVEKQPDKYRGVSYLCLGGGKNVRRLRKKFS